MAAETPTASGTTAPRRGLVAWALYDWASNAFPTLILTFVFAAYFTQEVAPDENIGTTLWGITLGIAGMIVAVIAPILGAIADQRGRHKPWIAFFMVICISATGLLWYVEPSHAFLWLALILLAIGAVGEEASLIFYHAMLPKLVEPSRLGRWSGWGWSAGYAGGLLCLVSGLVIFIQADPWIALDPEKAEPVRAMFVFAAAWYLLFAIPFFLVTPDTPPTRKPVGQSIRAGFGQLMHTVRNVSRYRGILYFVLAHMIYINGLATLFAFGGVYAAGTFGMSPEEVVLFGIALSVAAGVGAAGFGWITDWIGSKRTIQLSLSCLILLGTIILLVEQPRLFWIFGSLLGLFVGPVQAASRALLATVAPPAMRNEMFGLFTLSGKATSFAGPLAVAGLTWISGSQRIGMSAILAFFIVGLLLLLLLPISDRSGPPERGRGA